LIRHTQPDTIPFGEETSLYFYATGLSPVAISNGGYVSITTQVDYYWNICFYNCV